MSTPSHIPEVRNIQNAATILVADARAILIQQGKSDEDADHIVKVNFGRVNRSINCILNVDELCKPI